MSVFTYNFTSNNVTFNPGDSILVDFSVAFYYIDAIKSTEFVISPIDSWDAYHDVYIRWTYDVSMLNRAVGKPHTVWSSWEKITDAGKYTPYAKEIYDRIIRNPSDSIDLQYKLVRGGTKSGGKTIERVNIDFSDGVVPEEVSDSPIKKEYCKANTCPTTNFASGITISCDGRLFRPYDVINPAIKIYQEMSFSVSEMFGHCVRYFKTKAKLESADVVLKEYSLYEVTDVKDIKILIPDNELPDNALNFEPYDMDFGDGIEVHIIRDHFERAFGVENLPEQKDYIYFPLIDRFFEVQSAYLKRDFMASEVYYKVMLYKWQDKLNVMRDNPEIDAYVNSKHVTLDDIFGDELNVEYKNVTKPTQYTTVAIGGYDKVRSHINQNLTVQTKDLTNYFTVVGKYFYDLTKNMNWGDIAVQYKKSVGVTDTQNTAFTMWFKPQHTTSNKNTYDVLLDGYNPTEKKGFLFMLNYDQATGSPKSITLRFNESDYVFDSNFPSIDNNNWYAITINHLNEFRQAAVFLWKMKYDSSRPPANQNRTTDLQMIFSQTIEIKPEEIAPTDTTYQLRAGTIFLTNIRVWKEPIEEEKQPLILNQYVVKDNDWALIIDNAITPIRNVVEYVR
jgi:hypothetical protein